MLEEILRTATSAAVSFGLGLQHGYRNARYDANRKVTEEKVWQEDLVSIAVQVAYGLGPMLLMGPAKEEVPYTFGFGICGALIGGFVGSHIWRWKDYHAPMSVEDTKRFEAIKTRLKRLAITSPDAVATVGIEELVPYMQKLMSRKPVALTEQLKEDALEEIARYTDVYLAISESLTSDLACFMSVLPPKPGNTAGVIYVVDFDSAHSYELAIQRATILRKDDDPRRFVNIDVTLNENVIEKWDCEKLADRIAKDPRLVIIAGGVESVEFRKLTSIDIYRDFACEMIYRENSVNKDINREQTKNAHGQ